MSAYGFGGMIKKLKANPKTIVFTEGTDARILEAASRLLASNFLTPILIGNEDEIINAAEEEGYNIRGAQIIDPLKYDRFDEMVDLFCELRKSKGMTPEKARPILSQANYFGTMLVKMGVADCLLGGATYSTADTVRPALQIIKTKPGNSIVSSCFILVRAAATGGREVIAMGDCAININPSEDDLVEIAGETAECAKVFGIDPKVAFLSFSTAGSAKDPSITKVQNATKKAQAKYPDIPIDGEMQFDAAVSPRVGQQKMPGSKVAGYANTFIFPDINAGNLGYKIAQRMGRGLFHGYHHSCAFLIDLREYWQPFGKMSESIELLFINCQFIVKAARRRMISPARLFCTNKGGCRMKKWRKCTNMGDYHYFDMLEWR